MTKQISILISTLDELSQLQHYPSVAEFLIALTAGELTSALAAVLEIDRERLAYEVMRLQAAALEADSNANN